MKKNNLKFSSIHGVILLTFILFISCSSSMTELDKLNKKNPSGRYGEKNSLVEFSSLSKLLAEPNNYINKNVLVKGEIIDVCPMRGCWIKVKEDSTSNTIRVKVTDGIIVFPISAIGHKVDVEGKFVALNFSEDQARSWKVHLAEEKGILLNYDDVQIEESDLIEYRILGKSAKIY